MAEEIFADDVSRVEVIHGVVRVELAQAFLAKAQSETETATLDTSATHTLLFPPAGFARSFHRMKAVVEQLIASGAVKQGEDPNDRINSETSVRSEA